MFDARLDAGAVRRALVGLATLALPAMVLTSPLDATAVSFEQAQKLLASDAEADSELGVSLDLGDDTLVLGARRADAGGLANSGAAYIFDRDPGTGAWVEAVKLTASDAGAGDLFGAPVRLRGDLLAVGALFGRNADVKTGAVYLFERHHGGPDAWGEVAKLTADDGAEDDYFAQFIAISDDGDTIVVGALLDDHDGGLEAGAAYIFERDAGGPGNWGQVRKLTASDAAASDNFGASLGISGQTIAVGAFLEGSGGDRTGSVYLFERDAGGPGQWGEVKKITAPDAADNDEFGACTEIDGDTLVVGARLDDDAGEESGSVYVFERDLGGAGNWGLAAKLVASDGAAGARFGAPVVIDGDRLVIGAPDSGPSANGPGAAYVFERDLGGPDAWGEITKLTAADGALDDQFAIAVASLGHTIAVGARFDDDAGSASGSAYLYVVTTPMLTIPSSVPTPSNLAVNVPVTFARNTRSIAATTFSIDFDETCLGFDPTDGDGDGLPDAVAFSLPADFAPSVTYSALDTTGELDIAIADYSAPLAALPDGVLATVTFSPLCVPADTSLLAPVHFATLPAASFGDTAGQSVDGLAIDGSVEILPGLPGDCNDDAVIDAGDLSAGVLEVFDGDGDVWTDVAGGSFPGSPVGCDANQDFLVDAGDFACEVLLIFGGPGACAAESLPASVLAPVFRLGSVQSAGAGERVTVPLSFEGGGRAIASAAFSLDYDETCLDFDLATGVDWSLPAGMVASIGPGAGTDSADVTVSLLDPSLPFSTLEDGVLASLVFTTVCAPGDKPREAPVRFADQPRLSLGDTAGRSVEATAVDGVVRITSALFGDGFETGDTSSWSGLHP